MAGEQVQSVTKQSQATHFPFGSVFNP